MLHAKHKLSETEELRVKQTYSGKHQPMYSTSYHKHVNLS